MGKLYPPVIAGTIPAFFGNEITIPFQMNRAVGEKEVAGFCLKIKTVQNSRLIGTATVLRYSQAQIDSNGQYILDNNGNRIPKSPEEYVVEGGKFNLKNLTATFNLSGQGFTNNKLNIGQHYKIQLAYMYLDEANRLYPERAEVGHYSTIGVVKYTYKPIVKIQDLEFSKVNANRYSYLGIYAQKSLENNYNEAFDASEKLYSYCFNLYDSMGNIIDGSGWQIHNSTKDTEPNESICEYVLNRELDENKKYYIEFEVITNNKLHLPSGKYALMQKKSISPNVDFDIVINAEKEIENGGIVIGLRDNKEQEIQYNKILRTGSFKLMRTDEESDYTEWNEILSFKLFAQEAPYDLFTDYTVKQGVKYKYAIIQYNEHQLQSNKIESDIVSSDFEHIYLFDGKRQLKIKYNPKISSFKEVLLESKIDTIGAKHPFIFRNGNVEYKEFTISGLITSLMDENYLFFDKHKTIISPKNREYINNYIQVEVSDKYVYYYPEEWNKLYVKERRTENVWLTIKEYCYIKNIFDIKNSYNSKLIYAIKDPENSGKYLELSHDDISSNKKIYYYDQYKNNLYIRNRDEYIKYDNNLGYSPTETYYLSYAKTRQISNLNTNSFITNYSSNAAQTERDFKLEVLDWLNNGQPKLFRSPTEGNYIVRLMNSSLSPNEQLGRMLHNFNSTAYEVDEYKFENLIKNNLITPIDHTKKTIRWETIKLSDANILTNTNLLKYKAIGLRFEGMIPGDKVFINDGIYRFTGEYDQWTNDPKMEQGYTVVIGGTGSYNLDISDNIEITEVYFKSSMDNLDVDEKWVQHQGTLTYAYEASAFTSFDTIKSFSVEVTPLKQFFGKYNNIINEINDIKNQLQKIYFIHALLREQIDVYYCTYEGQKVYSLSKPPILERERINWSPFTTKMDDRYCIYRILDEDQNFDEKKARYYDAYYFKDIEDLTPEDQQEGDILYLNEEKSIKVFSNNDFLLKETDDINSIRTGYRILLEICYQNTLTHYAVESKPTGQFKQIYDQYQNAITEYNNAFNFSTAEERQGKRNIMELKYKDYIQQLIKELEIQGGIEGELV